MNAENKERLSEYDFDTIKDQIYARQKQHMREFLDKIRCDRVILGISGGKDSTYCAYLAAEVVGPENVYGVMVPNGDQADIEDSKDVIRLTGIQAVEINIEDAYRSIIDGVENNGIQVQPDTRINLPARLRMSTLYAVAQSVNGCVLVTDNRDECVLGYSTFGGDGFGSYAPNKNLTVGEVLKLSEMIGIPERLWKKVPSDGLCGQTDEDKLGFTYAEVDRLIRRGLEGDCPHGDAIVKRYRANKFKSEIVNVPGPEFDLPDYFKFIF